MSRGTAIVYFLYCGAFLCNHANRKGNEIFGEVAHSSEEEVFETDLKQI